MTRPADLGIDLGTTFSVLAVNGRVDLVPEYPPGLYLDTCDVTIIPTPYDEPTFPSAVLSDPADGHQTFGSDALRGVDSGTAPITFSKRKMGTQERLVLGEGHTTAKAVATDFLRYLKDCAEQALGRRVHRAVVTHPAYFDRAAVEETREAALAAGFDMSLAEQTLMEPVAAALVYTRADRRDPLRVLTYDLGGGTFDVTCLERRGGVIEMRAFEGDPLLGGYNFDRRIAQWILGRLANRGYQIALDEHDPAGRSRVARLLRLAERVKISLAGAKTDDARVLCRGRGILLDVHGRDVPIDEEISRAMFVDLIRDYLLRTVERAKAAVAKAEFTSDDLDEILLVGGSSRGPWIADAIREAFPASSCQLFEPDLCVAAGAAIHAAMILPTVITTDAYEVLLDVPEASPLDLINVRGRVRRSNDDSPGDGLSVALGTRPPTVSAVTIIAPSGEFLFCDVGLNDDDNDFELTVVDEHGLERASHSFSVRHAPELAQSSMVVSVQPRTLAVETLNGLIPLAEAGASLPCRCERTFLRQNDNPGMTLRLFQDRVPVGEIRLEGIPASLGRGTLVQLEVEVSGSGDIRGVGVLSAEGQATLTVPIHVRITPPVVPPALDLQRRFDELRDDWARTSNQDERHAGAIGPAVVALLHLAGGLFSQIPQERQEIHAALLELDTLLHAPADDMVPPLEEFRREVERCRTALDEMGASSDGQGEGDAERRRAERLRARARQLLKSLEQLERDGEDGHHRRDRRVWGRTNEALASLHLQAVRTEPGDQHPTHQLKFLLSMEVARELSRLNTRAAALRARDQFGVWRDEIVGLFQALNAAATALSLVDDTLPADQGRARLQQVMHTIVEPARQAIGNLGLDVSIVDKEALREAQVTRPIARRPEEARTMAPAAGAAIEPGDATFFDGLLRPGIDLEERDGNGFTPLMIAAYNGQVDFARALLSRGAQVDAANTYGWTALMSAVHQAHFGLAELLLAAGANPNAHTESGSTPLMLAGQFGVTECVDLLLSHGAGLDERDGSAWTALMQASSEGRLATACRLIEHGADLNAASDRGRTALMLASAHGRVQIIERLLQAGADADVVGRDGGTALMIAANAGHAAAVAALAPVSRDLERRDKDGDTALANACYQGHTPVAEAVLAHGADVNAVNAAGRTPLMIAAAHGHVDTVRALLAAGAQVAMRDHEGRTAHEMAVAGGHDMAAGLVEC